MITESIHLYIETVIISLSTASEILNRLGQIVHLMFIERARVYETYGGQLICWAHTFFPAKNSKFHSEHYRRGNILITFTYLMKPKLIYSWTEKNLFNYLHQNRLDMQSEPFRHPV